jgi:RNA polymerase sigma factor for flagellar operon FliA
LGDREKIVMSLYFYEGVTLGEIAQVLGVQTATARRIRRQALLHLEQRLGPGGVAILLEAIGR